jgi:hypothetical protein
LLRKAVALLLHRGGWTQQRIADHLGISQQQVTNDVNANISGNDIPEHVLRRCCFGVVGFSSGSQTTSE